MKLFDATLASQGLTLKQPEKLIEDAVLDWLHMAGCFCFKVKSTGTYDEKIKKFRSPGKRYMRGVSDILGIFKGFPVAFEIKTETGRLTIHQKLFQENWVKAGGKAYVVRSVEEARDALEKILVESNAA